MIVMNNVEVFFSIWLMDLVTISRLLFNSPFIPVSDPLELSRYKLLTLFWINPPHSIFSFLYPLKISGFMTSSEVIWVIKMAHWREMG